MDRITTVDGLIQEICKLLPLASEVSEAERRKYFMTDPDRTEILAATEVEVECLANLFDQLYEDPCITTGYYDPDEDAHNNEIDEYTGLYYMSIA